MLAARLMLGACGSSAGGGDIPVTTNLILWLDASDEATITDTLGSVTNWADKSGVGNDVQQDAVSPITGTRTVNSLNGIDFTSSARMKTSGAIQAVNSSAGTWTCFAVCVFDSTTTVRSVTSQDDSGGNRRAQFIRTSSGTSQSIAFNTGGGAFVDSGSAVSTSTTYVLEAVRTGSAVEVFVNGVSGGSTTTTGTPTAGTGIYTIGQTQGGAQIFDGIMCEIAQYDTNLGSTDRSDVRTYLADKWGVTL